MVQLKSKTAPNILFVGGVVGDDITVIDATIPAAANKYKPGTSVALKDGRTVPAEELFDQIDPATITGRRVILGGGGYNAITAFKPLSGIYGPKAARACLVTKMGSGPHSLAAKQALAQQGVIVFDTISDSPFDIPTNKVLQGTDDRLFVLNNSVFPAIDEETEEVLQMVVAAADLVHIHTRLPDLALRAAQIAHEKKKPVVLDASNFDADLFPRVLPLVTMAVLPDELEIRRPGPQPENPAQLIIGYMDYYDVPFKAVMCGGKPTLYAEDGGPVQEIPVTTRPGFEIIDKVGRGDIARAGLCLALARGETPLEAIRFANAVATYACMFEGQEWIKGLLNNPRDLERASHYSLPDAHSPPGFAPGL